MSYRFPCYSPECLRGQPLPSWDRTAALMQQALESMERWRQREAARLRRLYPQTSPLQLLVEGIQRAHHAP